MTRSEVRRIRDRDRACEGSRRARPLALVLPRPRALAARTRSLHPGASVRSAPSSRALGPWLRGRARSTRFRSRSRPSLGGAGTRLRTHRSCRLHDSQSRAAQGRSVAADGAVLGARCWMMARVAGRQAVQKRSGRREGRSSPRRPHEVRMRNLCHESGGTQVAHGANSDGAGGDHRWMSDRICETQSAYSIIALRRCEADGHREGSRPNAVSRRHDQYAPPSLKRVAHPRRASASMARSSRISASRSGPAPDQARPIR